MTVCKKKKRVIGHFFFLDFLETLEGIYLPHTPLITPLLYLVKFIEFETKYQKSRARINE